MALVKELLIWDLQVEDSLGFPALGLYGKGLSHGAHQRSLGGSNTSAHLGAPAAPRGPQTPSSHRLAPATAGGQVPLLPSRV